VSGAKRLLLLGLAAAGLLALVVAGLGFAGEDQPTESPSVTIEGVFPDFDPAEARYVSRCGRNAAPLRVEAGGDAKVAVGPGPALSGARRIDPGVRPGEDFPIAIVADGRRDTYRVRCLPADFPEWRFEPVRPAEPGLFVVSFKASRDARPWVIVFDSEGVPRWWYSPATRALWAQVLSDGSISWARSFGDGYGLDPRMAHEVRSPAGRLLRLITTRDSIVDGHELRELDGGNFLIDSYVPGKANLRRFGGPARAAVVSAEIEEVDPGGRVLWRWHSRDRIGLDETGRWWRNVLSNAKPGLRDLPTFDPVHINSIEPRGADELVISTRHTDAVYGIQRSTGEILWKLGGSETADSLRVLGDPARKLLGGQHDARIADDGSLSVYDNGKDRPRRPRVVFYRLQPEAGRAIYLGQLNDPAVKTSHCCGSARQLPDGGWLVSWGDNPLVTAFDEEGRIAFRLGLAASTFRAVPVPAGATTPAALDRGMERMTSGPTRR
jgi:Arylsulfotransferase (ASST)